MYAYPLIILLAFLGAIQPQLHAAELQSGSDDMHVKSLPYKTDGRKNINKRADFQAAQHNGPCFPMFPPHFSLAISCLSDLTLSLSQQTFFFFFSQVFPVYNWGTGEKRDDDDD